MIVRAATLSLALLLPVVSGCAEGGTNCDLTFHDVMGGPATQTVMLDYPDIDDVDDAIAQCEMDRVDHQPTANAIYACACATN